MTAIDEPTIQLHEPGQVVQRTADHRRAGSEHPRSRRCLIAETTIQRRRRRQYALNVQYAPRPAIPIQRIVGSSSAARCAGEFIHIDPMFAIRPHRRILTTGRTHHEVAHAAGGLLVVVLGGPVREIGVVTDRRQAVRRPSGIEPAQEAVRIARLHGHWCRVQVPPQSHGAVGWQSWSETCAIGNRDDLAAVQPAVCGNLILRSGSRLVNLRCTVVW